MAIYSDGDPLTGAWNARGMRKSRFSTNISLYLGQVFFRIWNMGGVNQPLGVPSLPSPIPFPFPIPPLPLSPSFPPEAGGVLCESWGVLTP